MKDKNGIEICWNNCHHKTAQNGCGITECDCDINDNKRCSFLPSKQAYEARIAELESRKPRAKRLVWDYIEGKTRAVLTDYMTLFIDEYGYPYRYCFGIEYKDDESTLECRFVREDDAKQAAQEWLDNLVEDCAEYEDKNQQKQVSTTNGTSESEGKNGTEEE